MLLLAHLVIVVFNIGSAPLILVGGLQNWLWIRNSWFRNIHLALIFIVVGEALFAVPCPLTLWEYRLREEAGHGSDAIGLIQRIAQHLIYYDFPPWVFIVGYLFFASLVVILYYRYPPRRGIFIIRR